tara:strand:+ start:16616 stop:16852 length:237 start_codon:yes stop_codon:yes gene_type:complete
MASQSKEEVREKIQEDVMAFLENGGKIKQCTPEDNLFAKVAIKQSKNRKGSVYERSTYQNFTISNKQPKKIMKRIKVR